MTFANNIGHDIVMVSSWTEICRKKKNFSWPLLLALLFAL